MASPHYISFLTSCSDYSRSLSDLGRKNIVASARSPCHLPGQALLIGILAEKASQTRVSAKHCSLSILQIRLPEEEEHIAGHSSAANKQPK